MLELININLEVATKKLFENLNLQIPAGEIHVFLGQNGVGKSSLAKMLLGHPEYKITGKIKYNKEDITNLDIAMRAKKGIYLLNQSPISIEGVTNAEMLRVALSEKEGHVNIFDFNKKLESICQKLELDKRFIHQEINVGCSGGERKKIELLHLWMLKPSLIILDEVDSGLDVDALRVVVNSLKEYYNEYHPTILIITHSLVLIRNFEDYKVHLLWDKKIIKSGNKDLASKVLNEGFKEIISSFNKEFDISEK